MNKPLFLILDKVFSDATIDTLYGHFRDSKAWKFIGEGNDNSNWRKFTYLLKKKNKIDNILFFKANEILRNNGLQDSTKLIRAYASGNIYGTVHDIHKDDGATNYNEIITIMFYLNKVWDMSYGGETIFLSPDQQEILNSVIPKPGRAVLFDGAIPHGAREVGRQCIELRMVVSFKYEVI